MSKATNPDDDFIEQHRDQMERFAESDNPAA